MSLTSAEIHRALREAEAGYEAAKALAESAEEEAGNLSDIRHDARAVIEIYDHVDGEDLTGAEVCERLSHAIEELRRCLP